MNVLDLFSGIGGLALGLKRAGMQSAAFCEAEPYCRRVLERRWPGVPIYDDVRTLTADRLRADGVSVNAIAGGADGLPYGMERNRAIGNAVAPDVGETIGRAIMSALTSSKGISK